jgi:hypothetical protein
VSRPLTRWRVAGRSVWRLEFRPSDAWIGVHAQHPEELRIGILPTLTLRVLRGARAVVAQRLLRAGVPDRVAPPLP